MRFFFLFFSILLIQLSAQENHKKKYRFSVCALFKNESKNLKEWIEYHRLIGVDHFYLYENSGTDSYMRVLRPYINQKLVTLIPWPDNVEKERDENLFKWSLSTLVPAYENVLVLHAKKETNWIVFLDIDEFIVPVDKTIQQILEKYESYPGVEISTDFFESTAITSPTKSLVIESTEITKAPILNSQEKIKKVIFKPELATASTWAPYGCIFKDSKEAAKLEKNVLRINRYLNRNKRTIQSKMKLYIDQKTTQPVEIEEILNSGYIIEDQQRVIYRFIPDVVKRLGVQY